MSPPIVAFFDNKGGVGKTSLVYHLAWMFSELGVKVLAADLDPQANLTSAFLEEDRLEELWDEARKAGTIYECMRPLIEGTGDVERADVEEASDNLNLVVGDLALSGFEDELSQEWSQCLDRGPRASRAFRVITAFWRVLLEATTTTRADVVLVDVGPNLGAINRAALVAADYVVVPLSPDLFSLQGLKNLGPTLRHWREQWTDRAAKNPGFPLPSGDTRPIGYIMLQHSVRLDRPVKAYARWMERIPGVYRRSVLDEPDVDAPPMLDDPHCIGMLKHYRSLMPMAQEARRPMFLLRSADGAIGAHQTAVKEAYSDFSKLAHGIARRIGWNRRRLSA